MYKKLLFVFLGIIFICGFSAQKAAASGLSKQPNNLGLVSYWSFDDGAGTSATDFSGHGYTGTFVGTPTWINGKRGKALSFPGTTHYVTAPDSSMITAGGDIAVSVWIKAPSGTTDYGFVNGEGGGTIISRGTVNSDWILFLQSGSLSWRGAAGGAGTVSCTPPSRDVWHHIVLSQAGTTATMYIDGVSCNSGATAAIPTSTGGIAIGTFTSPFQGNPFLGYIDEVRIYNRTISSTEAAALYASGAVKIGGLNSQINSGLVAYWPFDGINVIGTTAYDKSTNTNNGTLNSSPTLTEGKLGQGISFSGGSSVTVANHATINPGSAWTLSTWVYPRDTTAGNDQYPLIKGTTFGEWLDFCINCNSSSGYIVIPIAWDDVRRTYYTGITLTINTWAHLTQTFDGTTFRVYKDGVLLYSDTNVGSGVNGVSGTFTIGGQAAGTVPFNGIVDETRLYNRALSRDEVKQLYSMRGLGMNKSVTGPASSNLVLWHTFDGAKLNSTTSTDSSGNGYNGTLAGGPVPVLGKVGQALKFNGSADYITAGGSSLNSLPNNSLSVAAWFKHSTASPGGVDDYIIDKAAIGAASYGLYLDKTTTKVGFLTYDGTFDVVLSNSGGYNDDAWHHAVGVWDGTNDTIYVDGVLQSGSTAAGAATLDSTALFIGAYSDNGSPFAGSYWDGSIDDVRVYNRALSATEVLKLYNAGK